nr:zinc finger, CCHC-type [Tanacetum cinerariifolium]
MVNSMLSYSGLSHGFWGETMLTARITPYEFWTKRKPNLNYLRVLGCRAVVRLPDPKLKTLGERGIECIFVGYVEHSEAFRTPKDFGPEFQLYLIEATRDEVSDQHSYCFNVEDDPKTISDEMDSIMDNGNG